MGRDREEIETTPADGAALIAHLADRSPEAEALTHPSVRLIVNEEIVDRDQKLKDGDTVAFCPPFSGG
jgi:molybdopterin synthase sulfur carrier subunit